MNPFDRIQVDRPGPDPAGTGHAAAGPGSLGDRHLVMGRGEASVCLQHPGFDIDVTVTATTPALADVFQGYCSWHEAVDAGRIQVAGLPRLLDALPRWFLWSPWAAVTRERADRTPTR
ncbi:hypothetical protein KVF89_24765 [Nocardioides carbamazepini]|uniref:hypothetical protein n=1 Tax=Nocardioides carbamazepini TaxID=2854259 RepID=UPI00214A7E83|nr:hypothetical protein [Nocardioides carbamazepini]MCR1785773.1 hypothetical protein [Nocardioides carbamazepini]